MLAKFKGSAWPLWNGKLRAVWHGKEKVWSVDMAVSKHIGNLVPCSVVYTAPALRSMTLSLTEDDGSLKGFSKYFGMLQYVTAAS